MATFILRGDESVSNKRIDFAKELNQEQLAVVLQGDGACLVLAGAGSGKTRTLTYRVAYLLEQGADPSTILLLTFTNKAAREMTARVSSLVGGQAQKIWGGTFHSIAARLLRSFAPRLGYAANFSILDSDDAADLIKAVLKDLKIDPKTRRFPSASVTQNIISYARNVQSPIVAVLELKHPHFVGFVSEIEEIARQYQQRKKTANVMDFDDLLSNLAIVLEDPLVGPALAQRFRHVLVDEYQDTNAIQARIVKGFSQAHNNVLVVGDDAQSIYAFRGADVRNILSFPKQWPDSRMFKLVTNYRSTPNILELANESLAHNQARFEKDLVAVRSAGDKPRLVACASAAQEAQYIAEQILVLRQEGVALRNIAVLFRSSSHSQALEFELMKRDVPYEYRGGQKFFERAHIKDVLAFLRVRANAKDEIAWLRVLGLQQGIGAASASQIAVQVKSLDDLSSALQPTMPLHIPARAQNGWRDFTAIAQRLIEPGELPAGMLRGLLKSSYQDYLEREYPNWKERLEDLEQLALFAESYDELSAFLSDVSLYDEVVAGREQAGKGDAERLILSTIHQAKGLEWDTVFILHLADNAFPNRRALAEEGGLEEERRLFYVAVTRARRQLFLTYPLTMGYESLMFNQPSTFLEEVSPRLFERVELREARSSSAKHLSSAEHSNDRDDWSWDEPTIQLDEDGERRSAKPSVSVWKPSTKPNKPKTGSFLREVEDL